MCNSKIGKVLSDRRVVHMKVHDNLSFDEWNVRTSRIRGQYRETASACETALLACSFILCLLPLSACSGDDNSPSDARPPYDARLDASPADAWLPPFDARPDASRLPPDALLDASYIPPDAPWDGPTGGNDAVTDAPLNDAAIRLPVTIIATGNLPAGVHGMAISNTGRLFYSDSFKNQDPTVARVYYLDAPYTGQPISTGIVALLPTGLLWEDSSLFLCDTQAGKVFQFNGSFNLVKEWTASAPWNVARDSNGDLLTVSNNGALQRLNADGTSTTLFTGMDFPFGLAPLSDGTVWISEQGVNSGRVTRRTLEGAVIDTVDYPWENPEGLLLDERGTLWIADTMIGSIVRVDGFGLEVVSEGLRQPIVLAGHSSTSILTNVSGGTNPRLHQIELGE